MRHIILILGLIYLSPFNAVADGLNLQKQLIEAIKSGNETKVKELIEKKADLNFYSDDDLPLIVATKTCNQKIIELLLKQGAHINGEGHLNQIPLMHAAEYCSPEINNFLIKKGAHLKHELSIRRNVLMYAARNKNLETLKFYVEKKKFKLEAHDDFGGTALIYAVEVGPLANVKYLLEKGASLNLKTATNESILMKCKAVCNSIERT